MMNNNKNNEDDRVIDLTTTRDAKRQRLAGASTEDLDKVVLNAQEQKVYNDLVFSHSGPGGPVGGSSLEISDDVFLQNHSAAKVIGKINDYLTEKKASSSSSSSSNKVVTDITIYQTSDMEVGGIGIILSPFVGSITRLTLDGLDEKVLDALPQTLCHCSSLKELQLGIDSGSPLQLTRLIESIPTLKEISVYCTSLLFQDTDIESIKELIVRGLCRLEEVSFAIPGSLASVFIETLCGNSTTIRTINLNCLLPIAEDEFLDRYMEENPDYIERFADPRWGDRDEKASWNGNMTKAVLKNTSIEGVNNDIFGVSFFSYGRLDKHFRSNILINKARGLLKYHAMKEKEQKEGGSNNFPSGLYAKAIERLLLLPHDDESAAKKLATSLSKEELNFRERICPYRAKGLDYDWVSSFIKGLKSRTRGNKTAAYLLIRSQLPKWVNDNNNNKKKISK